MLLAGLAWLLGLTGPLAAQTPGPSAGGSVELRVLQFGVGNQARPGDWAGIQVAVLDRAARPRPLLVRLALPDADGDTAWVQADLTSVPGQEVPVWLYARLPFALGATPSVTFTVLQYPEGVAPEDAVGAPVGTLAFAATLASEFHELGAVVGRNEARLEQYAVRYGDLQWSPMHHELMERPAVLRVADLPDRWMGLAPFGLLAWTGRDNDADPARLTESQRQAVVEWVTRGGHLVVVPPVTDPIWLNPQANPLIELMPRVTPVRDDSADLNAIRGVLMRPAVRVGNAPPAADLPAGVSLRTFSPVPGAGPGEAMSILAGADGRALVARRLVGQGAVSLVGIDLLAPALAGTDFEADVFWHRVLGRRGQLEDAAGLQLLASGSGLSRRPLFLSQRTDRLYDRGIPGAIAKTGRAAAGLLVAFGVFGVYWLLAGPLGYAVLKRQAVARHAWMAFVLSAGVFTAIAWGAAGAAKPREIEGQHLTILDHVYGQGVDRARMWISLLLPQHGSQAVRVIDQPDLPLRSALATFDSPSESLLSNPAFPDARGYPVNARDPSTLRVPTRATVKQFQVDWAGAPAWRMPTPVTQTGPGIYDPNGVIMVADRDRVKAAVEGVLVHNLPAALADVTVVVVSGQDLRRNTAAGQLLSTASAFKLASGEAWQPGEPLDLAVVTADAAASGAEQFFADLVPPVFAAEAALADRVDAQVPQRLLAMSFLPLFEPPDMAQPGVSQPLARRRLTHTLDLARWFTQPCVIVIGQMVGPTPVPLAVDDRPAEVIAPRLTGRTMVRWVYPLPSNPPRLAVDNAAPSAP